LTTSTVLSESELQTIARDGTQSLLNTLLSHCDIHSTPDGPTISLALKPTSEIESLPTPLPRWKPLPKPKAPTKWETFARKKGIGKFGGNMTGGAKLEDRRKNMVYDEESGEWVKKWGYKGKNKGTDGDWLVELDDEKVNKEKGMSAESGMTIRGEGKRERMERMRRQDRKERNNERRGKKGGAKLGGK
jgi:regulator of ribosome biosynthesis